MAALTADSTAEARPGVLDLYRELWLAARAAATRYRLALVVELTLIGLYVALRTGAASREALELWLAAAIVAAVVAPASGLTVLAAIAPFSEPFTITRDLGAKPVLLVAIAVAIALRLVVSIATERRAAIGRPSWALVFGLLIGVGTLAGIAVSVVRIPVLEPDVSLQLWLAGVGGAMLVLASAYWCARQGHLRPFVVAVAAATAGGVVSLLDWLDAGQLRESAMGWVLRPDRIQTRLTGIIPSPNGVASLVIVPVGVYAAALALARDIRLRAIAAVALPVLVVTLYFTYSRAALLGIFVVAVIVAWKVRRVAGIALLAVGIVAGAILLPGYLQSRAGAVGGEGAVDPSGVFVASDAHRIQAWRSATQMFIESPLVGHGFLAYRELHEDYGDPVLRSPHNEWLRLFAEGGVLVGLAGLAFGVSTFVGLWRRTGWLATGALAAFAGWAVAATFNNPLLFIQVGVIVFTVVGTGLAHARPIANDQLTDPGPHDPWSEDSMR